MIKRIKHCQQANLKANPNYIQLMNQSLGRLVRDALKLSFPDPGQVFFLLGVLIRQTRAAGIRKKWEKKGVHVPPLMIISVTHQCNLHCKGCYAQAHQQHQSQELSVARLREIIAEAGNMGISIALLAGGEPLARPKILEIAAGFPELIFPVFTNGLLVDETMIRYFKTHKNVIPVISLEGDAEATDERRGEGVYQRLRQTLLHLKHRHIFYGVSVTATRANFNTIKNEAFVGDLLQNRCRLFFYVEYVPVKEDTTDWVLTEQQRAELLEVTGRMRADYPALFIVFPGDEEQFGGCLAAGRGFIHISPTGDLEPCPFSPFSDTNLSGISLKEALQSNLLATIRAQRERLTETGGCALWENREWVSSLLRK
jgi:MoaA/NifB/PqqE/SkfB family radical SAM enzyme